MWGKEPSYGSGIPAIIGNVDERMAAAATHAGFEPRINRPQC
jgi:hypothetical protein